MSVNGVCMCIRNSESKKKQEINNVSVRNVRHRQMFRSLVVSVRMLTECRQKQH